MDVGGDFFVFVFYFRAIYVLNNFRDNGRASVDEGTMVLILVYLFICKRVYFKMLITIVKLISGVNRVVKLH